MKVKDLKTIYKLQSFRPVLMSGSSSFLKLFNKSMVINTTRLIKIKIQDNAFNLHMVNSAPWGFAFYGTGGFFCDNTIIKIDAKQHPDDFARVQEWLLKLH